MPMPALHCRLQSASSQLSSQPRSIRPLAAAAAPRRPQRSNTRPATAAAPLLFSLIRARAAAQSSSSDSSLQYGGEEKVLDIQLLLLQEDDDLEEEDENGGLPAALYGEPLTPEEVAAIRAEEAAEQQQQAPDPVSAVSEVLSAYSAEGGFQELSPDELSAMLLVGVVDLLLDVRSVEEFEAGPTIPSAVNIPLESLSDAVRGGSLDTHMAGRVVVVCSSGTRSAQAAVRLSRVFNFKHVINLAGGMAAWAQRQQQQPGSSSGGGGGGCGCGGGGGGGGGCHS